MGIQNLIPEYAEKTISSIYACESSIAEVVHIGPNEVKILRKELEDDSNKMMDFKRHLTYRIMMFLPEEFSMFS